ncbi:hypothetical protein [Streptomyces sp. NPDC057386]|uniref:Membrane-bound hydrophilic protein n=1 Tax=Streptomyces thermocoprophilus TaxID=78356 RepID=A0ABV5VCJ5_9ACTN
MPADEVTHGTDADASRVRTGPRHAAPKKPLFTRFHMPAGKAIASVAMPTAVLMGMGFTASLAVADNNPSATQSSKLADEFKECVEALGVDGADASATPSPSASASESAKGGTDGKAEPEPSASGTAGGAGSSSSSGSGTDDRAASRTQAESEPSTPSAASAADAGKAEEAESTPAASPSPSETHKSLLESIGDAITGVFTGGLGAKSPSTTPSPSASATPEASASGENTGTSGGSTGAGDSGTADKGGSPGAVKDTVGKVTGTVKDTVDDVTDTAEKAAGKATEAAGKAVEDAADATASPSPSASASAVPEDCEVATDAEGGVDNKIPVADDPWYLEASSLLLKGADYQGIVEVQTANGTKKKVLKYVIGDGTDIGDLHQLVKDKNSGKTYHVQAGKGTTSTIRDGDTVMYTESISGNLFGLIPITFSPDNPPPLNIPLIYFTNVKVTQAAQFGGKLTIPGMHLYTT